MSHLAKPLTFSQKIKLFFNNKSTTLIAASMALCIGFALKDLIATAVKSVIEPFIVYIICVTHLEKIYDFKQFISKQNNTINISKFIQSLLTFIIIIIIVFNLFQHITS